MIKNFNELSENGRADYIRIDAPVDFAVNNGAVQFEFKYGSSKASSLEERLLLD